MTDSPAAPEDTVQEFDVPVPYMQRTRDYYLAIGYDTPYRWAHNVAAPFQRRRARRRRSWPVALPVSVTGAAERGEHKPAVPVPHYPH